MKYSVVVEPTYRFGVVRSAGREFAKGEAVIIHSSDAGSAEILACPLLVATEIAAAAEQGELNEVEDDEADDDTGD